MVTSLKGSWVRLDESNERLLITSREGETYSLPYNDALIASRSAAEFRDYAQQIADLMDDLLAWLDERDRGIDRACVALNPEVVKFVVIRRESGFDPELEDDLSELDLKVLNEGAFAMLDFQSIALPDCSDDAIAFIHRDQERLLRETAEVEDSRTRSEVGDSMSSDAEHLALANRFQAAIDHNLTEIETCAEVIAIRGVL